MSKRGLYAAVLVVTACAGTAGCATSEEWSTWYNHRTHFASGDHMSFSIRTPEGSRGQVTRTQVGLARDEGWWGKPVTVEQTQILDR